MTIPPSSNEKSKAFLSLFFGGLLPVIVFTVIEEKYGVKAGLIAGLIFGAGEIIFELIKYKKVSMMTWVGNTLLISLGTISLFSDDGGLLFKLQPALLELFMFVVLFGSWIIKKPFLKLMVEKQNPDSPEILKLFLSGLTLRISLFMLAHALIATYAAFYWSTTAWAILKGVGLTVSLILYMGMEILYLRYKIKNKTD